MLKYLALAAALVTPAMAQGIVTQNQQGDNKFILLPAPIENVWTGCPGFVRSMHMTCEVLSVSDSNGGGRVLVIDGIAPNDVTIRECDGKMHVVGWLRSATWSLNAPLSGIVFRIANSAWETTRVKQILLGLSSPPAWALSCENGRPL